VAAGTVPVSTYRLQLTPDFGFAAAAATAEYLASLGVSHVYLSPILEAVPGSRHGYDVTDHSRIRAELGGEHEFRVLASRLRAAGLGIVLDIVPNHMAAPANLMLNRQLWSVLRDGRDAAFATWFDVDWAAQDDRMLLPVLRGPLDSSLPDLQVAHDGGLDGEPALRYFDHVLPLSAGTARLPMRDLLARQHYRLTWWRDASAQLNWRRFFDISTLIALRVEDPVVFAATHEVIVRLVSEGLVDGLRVDHPDGLADPRGYLRQLAAATGGAWVVAEKILAPDESLPFDWPCAGTTGYDALRLADGVFVDPAGRDALSDEYAGFSLVSARESVPARFAEVTLGAKREVAARTLRAEVRRLARLLVDILPDASADEARTVLTEILACFPVYRAYVYPGEFPAAASVAAVRAAVDAARRRLPRRTRSLADRTGAAALGMLRPVAGAVGRAGEFAVRFQQTTGPVLAKGVEDTAAYRWPRLLTLNEVGGDPDLFGVDPGEFHAAASRLAADWPATMTTLSTHDTKRQEDVRARLAVLAELPAEWGTRVKEWHDRAVALRFFGQSAPAVDPDTEYLLWQTLVGTWPISGDRLAGYLTKAIREDERRTTWTDPDPGYESAVLGLAARVLDDPELTSSIGEFVASIADAALANSLGVKLVQLTMTGVPDVYQGCELGGFALVDPDNRRKVDFAVRTRMLESLDAAAGYRPAGRPEPAGGGAWPGDRVRVADHVASAVARLDAAKLLVTARALRLRRAEPGWFAGDYAPLAATGAAAGHVLAFQRGGHAVTVVTRLSAGLRRRGGWADTALRLPGTAWTDLISGLVHEAGVLPLGELTRELPVALLIPLAR
jgi:(1->4)-alpha-D-glucan 1-alpha-D-glucosylmutase